jgi:hypothetical protein
MTFPWLVLSIASTGKGSQDRYDFLLQEGLQGGASTSSPQWSGTEIPRQFVVVVVIVVVIEHPAKTITTKTTTTTTKATTAAANPSRAMELFNLLVSRY